MEHSFRKVLLAAALAVAVAGAPLLARSAVAADEPDLSTVRLEPRDLPEGFAVVPEDRLDARGYSVKAVGERLAQLFESATLERRLVYSSADRTDVVELILVGPLTASEAGQFRALLAQPDSPFVSALVPSFSLYVDYGEPVVVDSSGIGDASTAATIDLTVTSDRVIATNIVGLELRAAKIRVVIAVRGTQLFIVDAQHAGTEEPDTDLLRLARVVDERLASALGLRGHGATPAFRPVGDYSPAVAAHIPTLTQVSTEGRVVTANLVLAAIAALVLGVSTRLLTSTLSRHEGAMEQLMRPARVVGKAWRALDDGLRRHLGRAGDAVRVGGELLFYGVLFSFLEPGWNPFSVAGLVVLVVMTIAFGLVGNADDLSELATARRSGVVARLVVKPALALMAVVSVVLTKVAGLVPGIFIGTPEAFSLEGEFGERQRGRVAAVGIGTTALIGLAAWGLSAPLDGALGSSASAGDGVLAGVVALLVLVYAVAVENLFANLIGFPGSEGDTLRKRSPLAWAVVVLAVTALFFHTLVNPAGDLGQSMRSTNVRVVMATVGVFSLASVIVWLAFRRRTGEAEPLAAPHTDAGPALPPPAPLESPAPPSAWAPPDPSELVGPGVRSRP